MATQIAEPSDLPAGSITDENANHFRVLVYQQDQEFAGIKTLGIGDWKTFLNFNGVAVDNVATFVGIDIAEYNYKATTPQSLPEGVYSAIARINNVAEQCGVQTNPVSPAVFTPLLDRITAINTQLDDPTDGLSPRMTNAESNIEELWDNVGGSGTTPGSTLTSRVTALETTVGNSTSGLVEDVTTLQSEVEDSSNGLIKKVGDIETEIGIYSNAEDISTRLNNLETKTGADSSYTDTNSIDSRLVAIETNTGVALADNYDVSTNGTLLQRIEDVERTAGSAYHYQGDIISCVGDTLNLSGGSSITLTELKSDEKYTGYVYNIKPTTGDTITIDGVTFSRGANIAWIWKNAGNGYFDELGASIDVSEITALRRDVNTLQSDVTDIQTTLSEKFLSNGSSPSAAWTSNSILKDGMYLVTGYVSNPTPANTKLESFIGYFKKDSGIMGCVNHNDIHIESSDSIFIFNPSNLLVSAKDDTVLVRITQIG